MIRSRADLTWTVKVPIRESRSSGVSANEPRDALMYSLGGGSAFEGLAKPADEFVAAFAKSEQPPGGGDASVEEPAPFGEPGSAGSRL